VIAGWSAGVAIYRIFQQSAFLPEDTKRLGEAYELALVALRIRDRNDPVTETIAQCIIEIGQTGEKEPARICALAVEQIRTPK
jgi:hypothetical protein